MESQARVIEATGTGAELAPETVLPSQFFDRLQGDSSLQPEKRLMLAVLEDAVGTFQKYVNVRSRHGRRLFSEAEEWFASHDGDWPFAFVSVCLSGSKRTICAPDSGAGGIGSRCRSVTRRRSCGSRSVA